jgi:hypothetical protein
MTIHWDADPSGFLGSFGIDLAAVILILSNAGGLTHIVGKYSLK